MPRTPWEACSAPRPPVDCRCCIVIHLTQILIVSVRFQLHQCIFNVQKTWIPHWVQGVHVKMTSGCAWFLVRCQDCQDIPVGRRYAVGIIYWLHVVVYTCKKSQTHYKGTHTTSHSVLMNVFIIKNDYKIPVVRMLFSYFWLYWVLSWFLREQMDFPYKRYMLYI